MDRSLIFDIGIGNGDDTAHYLSRGYRVVAVDAVPDLIAHARRRFSPEIEAGRLDLIHAAITRSDGDVQVYLNDTVPEWTTVDRDRTEWLGGRYRELYVPGIRFGEVLAAHGTPYYVKIDIEGSDRLCLEDLRPGSVPAYLSFEWSPDVVSLIEILASLGYQSFKGICQSNFLPLEVDPSPHLREALHEALRIQQFTALAHRARDRFTEAPALNSTTWGRPIGLPDGSSFAFGSSGPFGEATLGRWQTSGEILDTVAHFGALHQAGAITPFWSVTTGAVPWVDIHARLQDRPC